MKLLHRLYDPADGQILLDGIDLREYDLEDLYREIGDFPGFPPRYEMTARENIERGFYRPGRQSAAGVQQSARKSLAHDVVQRLQPMASGDAGRRFDAGVDLSGGEWQKLEAGLAYLRDAQVLVLTSRPRRSMLGSEYEVFQRFAELTAGKMALFISHRFSTVRMADRIVVLEQWADCRRGNHDALTRQGGRYAEMFEMQAASYR